jgi:MFS family permease
VTGTTLFALSSLAGGLANSDAVMIAARLAQGLGAAMMTPAALSILTTSFSDGSDTTDLLPGLVVMALGLGAVMVGVQNAANAGVPTDKAGLAAALITTSSTVGAALGLAILTAIATSRTSHLVAAHADAPQALTGGFHSALVACSACLVGAAVIAARATNTRGERATGHTPAEALVNIPETA